MYKFVLVVCFTISVGALCLAVICLADVLKAIVAVAYSLVKLVLKLVCHIYKVITKGYKKELPFDTVCLRLVSGTGEAFFEPGKDKKLPAENSEAKGFVILYEKRQEATRNRKEFAVTVEDNRERLWKFKKVFVKNISGKEPCLLYSHTDCQKDSDGGNEENGTFDIKKDKRLVKWLSSQQQIVSRENTPIAVRGIDGGTMKIFCELGEERNGDHHELIVPNASEQELRESKLDDLVKYHEIENCKFKINNCCTDGMYFEFSEVPGYTKEELIEKARELAESMGYKFKVKEIGKE